MIFEKVDLLYKVAVGVWLLEVFSFVFPFSSTMGVESSRPDMSISALMTVIWRFKYLYCKQNSVENVP